MRKVKGQLALGLALLVSAACGRPNAEEQLTRRRNLGKAYYENAATRQQAVREFKQALDLAPGSAREKINYALALLRASGHDDEAAKFLRQAQRQDPSLPHTWFNLGVYYKKRGDARQAIAQFEGMIARAPEEPMGHYQLGALYRQVNRNAEAQVQLERAAELDPQLAAAPFQLYNLHRLAGDAPRAARYLADFRRIQGVQKAWVTPEDVDWRPYAEIYDPPEARAEAPAPPEPIFADTRLEGGVDAATAGLTLIDSAGDGQTDLLAWSSKGIRLYQRGRRLAPQTGLEGLSGVIGAVPGDFDNDGRMDLCSPPPARCSTATRAAASSGSPPIFRPAVLKPRRGLTTTTTTILTWSFWGTGPRSCGIKARPGGRIALPISRS